MIEGLVIEGISDISELVSSMEISLTLDSVSQITFNVWDEKLELLANNYFQIRRVLTYNGIEFEIAAAELSQGLGKGGMHKIEARRRVIQQMKRDKSPQSYGGVSATDYARILAEKFGLKFVGQTTAVKRSIVKATSGNNAESAWDVLRRLAGEAQFSVFESEGTLYFASQEWLIQKWGNYEFRWPAPETGPFMMLEIPTCRRSDDDPNAAEFQASLARPNATGLRPGMTINLRGLYAYDGPYLISEVAYAEGEDTPVGISCKTPEKMEDKT